jgi:molybdenum cofactor cytidylyltransferase
MTKSVVHALVLAAGLSRRFGADKLLADLAGTPVLAHALGAVVASIKAGLLEGGLVILPADVQEREALVRRSGLEYALNPSASEGVSTSLKLGLHELASRHPDVTAALIVQGDQPHMPADLVAAIITARKGEHRPVVRPRYAGEPHRPGHPVLLERSCWNRVSDLHGDEGFGPLLKSSPELVTLVDVPGINPDINTPSDLAQWESRTL